MRLLVLFPVFAGNPSRARRRLRAVPGLESAAAHGQGGDRLRATASLTGFDLSVISAALIPPTASAPEHCHVFLMAQPEINIEVNLPTNWNGRFYMFGNGGWAGEAFDAPGRVANHARALRAGFATASTDTGHNAAAEPGASFALNRQKLLDFGFRSLHVTAEAAKQLIHRYYDANPSRSYFDGCSQGGRQALTLAQRFPDDFDGIISGSPALYNSGNMVARAYWMQGMGSESVPCRQARPAGGPGLRKVRRQGWPQGRGDRQPPPTAASKRRKIFRAAPKERTSPTVSPLRRSHPPAASTATSSARENASFPAGPRARKFAGLTGRAAGWARRSACRTGAASGPTTRRVFFATWRSPRPIPNRQSRISISTKTSRDWSFCTRSSTPPTPISRHFAGTAANSSCISAGPTRNSIRGWPSSITSR